MTDPNILAPVAALTLPDAAGLTSRAQQALAFIEEFEVDSAETYALAGDELKAIKARANALEQQRTGITGPINSALRAINDLFRGPAGLLERAVVRGVDVARAVRDRRTSWSIADRGSAPAIRHRPARLHDAPRRMPRGFRAFPPPMAA